MQGCYDELVAWIEDNAVILIAVAFAISAIEVRIPLRYVKLNVQKFQIVLYNNMSPYPEIGDAKCALCTFNSNYP